MLKKNRVLCILVVVLILNGLVYLLIPIVEKDTKYRKAINHYNKILFSDATQSEYENLIETFKELSGYKVADKYYLSILVAEANYYFSKKDIVSAYKLYKKAGFSEKNNEEMEFIVNSNPNINLYVANEGDIVKFGKYEQDGNLENGYEDLEWIVLKVAGTRKLLFTRACIEAIPYNFESGSITWSNSSINSWMNSGLFDQIFSNREKTLILSTTLDESENPDYGTRADEAEGKLFLLSVEEIEYYKSDLRAKLLQESCDMIYLGGEELAPELTDYMIVRGAESQCLGYWLRTPAIDYDGAVYVSLGGYIHTEGDGCVKYNLVRPAVWIDVSELEMD